MIIQHRFVEFIPRELDEKTLYISVEYGSAAHLCFCGCGAKVVTPLTPTDWTLIYNGKVVSLDPSVGNWELTCHSHYWIWESEIRWAEDWSQEKIERARKKDNQKKANYHEGVPSLSPDEKSSFSISRFYARRIKPRKED